MSLAACQHYVKSLLDQMPWPAAMLNLPPPSCYIQPPNPNVSAEIPAIYIWMTRGRESRDTSRLRAGTVPRISGPGGPSGTKPVEHTIPVWLVWNMSSDDSDADNLFPGMIWAVQAVLRSAAAGAGGVVAADPQLLTDPWTGEKSWLVDIGEVMSYETYERTLESQGYLRLDAVIDLQVTEIIAA
jgi:hypothetical protein